MCDCFLKFSVRTASPAPFCLISPAKAPADPTAQAYISCLVLCRQLVRCGLLGAPAAPAQGNLRVPVAIPSLLPDRVPFSHCSMRQASGSLGVGREPLPSSTMTCTYLRWIDKEESQVPGTSTSQGLTQHRSTP